MAMRDHGTGGRSSDRRDAILRAALACFADKGVARTSIADIRAASGASVGSIYHHFGGKEGLASAVLVEAFADYQEGAGAIVDADPSAREGIEALVRHHMSWIGSHPEQVRFMLAPREPVLELASNRDFAGMNRSFLKKVQSWYGRRVADGSLRPLATGLFYALLVGPSQEYARLWTEGRFDPPDEALANELARAAWQALRGDAPA
jgi:AcrR family transcriptional regulator